MATPALRPSTAQINFSKNLPYRSGAAGITITANNDPLVIQAILADRAFPPGDIELIILRPGSRFALPDFIKGIRPARADVFLDQPITNA